MFKTSILRSSNRYKPLARHSRGTDSKLVADVPVSAPQTQIVQLEATIRSAHALLQAGLTEEATSLLAVFRRKFNRTLTENLPRFGQSMANKRSEGAKKITLTQLCSNILSCVIIICMALGSR